MRSLVACGMLLAMGGPPSPSCVVMALTSTTSSTTASTSRLAHSRAAGRLPTAMRRRWSSQHSSSSSRMPTAPRMSAAAPGGSDPSAAAALRLRTAWARGDDATALRSLVEDTKDDSTTRAAAVAAASSTDEWTGLWVARIEHFGKLWLNDSWMNPPTACHPHLIHATPHPPHATPHLVHPTPPHATRHPHPHAIPTPRESREAALDRSPGASTLRVHPKR